MKTIKMLAMAIIIAGMCHANSAKGQEANGIKVEKMWEVEVIPKQWVEDVWFSASGKYVFAKYSKYVDRLTTCLVFDSNTGSLVQTISYPNSDQYIDRTPIHPRLIFKDSVVLIPNEDMTSIDFHNLKDMSILGRLEKTNGTIYSYNISQDEKYLIANVGQVASFNKLVIWDIETKKILKEKEMDRYKYRDNETRPNQFVNANFIPNSNQIYVGTVRYTYKGTDIKQGAIYDKNYNTIIMNYQLDSINTLNKPNVFFTNSGKYYVTWHEISYEGSFLDALYEYKTNQLIRSYAEYDVPARDFSLSDDLRYIYRRAKHVRDICFIDTENNKRLFFSGLDDVEVLPSYSNSSNHKDGLIIAGAIVNDPTTYRNVILKYKIKSLSNTTESNFINSLSTENPIVKETNIQLFVGNSGKLKIVLSDERGAIINELTNQYYEEGNYSIDLKTNNLPNGLYFLTLTDNSGSHTQKIIIER